MDTVLIRPEAPADIPAICRVIEVAFENAPHTTHTEHHIVRDLRQAGALTLSLVADRSGSVVGHVAISPVTTMNSRENWFGLGPISVLPDQQHKGIGTKLMKAALEALRRGGAAGCVVLGEPSYYGRFGFLREPGLVLKGVPPEFFQAIAFTAKMASGEVSYHESFGTAR